MDWFGEQAVPNPTHGLNHPGVKGSLQLSAKSIHQHIERIRWNHLLLAPNGLDEALPRDWLAGNLLQGRQQKKFSTSELNRQVVSLHCEPCGIEHQLPLRGALLIRPGNSLQAR